MTADNKEYTTPEQESGVQTAAQETEAVSSAAPAPEPVREDVTDISSDNETAATDGATPEENADDEDFSAYGNEPGSADTDEFRPADVSEDGSPHGPLDLFSEEDEEKKESEEPATEERNVPTFAAFHSPEPKEDKPVDEDEEEEEEDDEDDAPMTIMGHLNELRRRLFRIVIIVILGFVAFYGVAEPLYGFLSEPLKVQLPEGSKLIYTSPAGAFFTYMKVALVASLFGTSPFSFYQIWAFIAPGLYKEEKRAVLPLAFFSSVFFLAGAAFCFFLVFPIAFKFFMGFATDTIVPMISVEEYLGFALKLLIAFGVVFEMPLFAYFLSRFGILSPEFMRRQRRYAILLIFIVAAILTPPDVFSQCLMAMPMLLLYEVSIYVSAMAYKKKEKKNDADPAPSEDDGVNEEETA